MKEDLFSEEIYGKTPNGGVKSVWMYSDLNGNPVVKSRAQKCEIHEIDESGSVIFRTYGTLSNTHDEK